MRDGDPGGPARGRDAAAVQPRPGGRARRLARRRQRGLRPARRRGLSASPPGRAGAGRQRRSARSASPAGALAAAQLRLRLPPRACPTSPASPATAGCARCAPRGGKPRSTPSATPTRAASRRCARRSPTISAGPAAPPPTPSTCSSAPASRQGLSLLCRWLAEQGVERVALEDPGWHRHRLIVEQAGLAVGRSPSTARACGSTCWSATAPAVIVTPAHQFPTGVVLSSERRAALIEWAERGERLIVEDDYDAELRYDRTGVGALQGLAPERVVLHRLGEQAARAGDAARLDADPVLARLAADLGRRRSRTAARRRSASSPCRLHRARRARPPPAPDAPALRAPPRGPARQQSPSTCRRPTRAKGTPASSTLALPESAEETVIAAAAERGLGVEGLSLHTFSAQAPPTLVLGFASLPEPTISRGIRALAEAVASTQ